MLPVDIGGGEFVGWPLRVSGGASGAFLCPPPPVLVHMSMGFMMLALALCIVLLFTMGLSFWPFLRRLIKVDLVFSFLSFSIGKCQLGGGVPSPPQHLSPGRGSLSGFQEVYLRVSVLPSGGSVSGSLSGFLSHRVHP